MYILNKLLRCIPPNGHARGTCNYLPCGHCLTFGSKTPPGHRYMYSTGGVCLFNAIAQYLSSDII